MQSSTEMRYQGFAKLPFEKKTIGREVMSLVLALVFAEDRGGAQPMALTRS